MVLKHTHQSQNTNAVLEPVWAAIRAAFNLSDRQLQVAQLLLAGNIRNKIAETLCISPETVRKHIDVLYRKVGVSVSDATVASCVSW